MTKAISRRALAAAAIVAAAWGCKRDEAPLAEREGDQRPPGLVEQGQPPEVGGPGALGRPGQVAVEPGGDLSIQRATAEQLWLELVNYRDWTARTAAPVAGEHPFGEHIQLFYNDTAKAAIGQEGDWPNDVILVKDNYATHPSGDGPGELAAITVMKKGAGVWFWAQYKPDGSLFETEEGTVVAGTADIGCVDCHTSVGLRDHVITKLGGS